MVQMVHHENRPKPKRKFILSGIHFQGQAVKLEGGKGTCFWMKLSHLFSGQEEQFPDVCFWQEPSLEQWNQGHLRVDFIHIPYTPNRKAKHFFFG